MISTWIVFPNFNNFIQSSLIIVIPLQVLVLGISLSWVSCCIFLYLIVLSYNLVVLAMVCALLLYPLSLSSFFSSSLSLHLFVPSSSFITHSLILRPSSITPSSYFRTSPLHSSSSITSHCAYSFSNRAEAVNQLALPRSLLLQYQWRISTARHVMPPHQRTVP